MTESGVDLAFDALMEDGSAYIKTEQDRNKQYYELKSRPVFGSPPVGLESTPFRSRTQLKLELARQQHYDQEAKKEVSQSLSSSWTTHTPAVPFDNSGQSVLARKTISVEGGFRGEPPPVLKVRTVLPNQTRFHVEQRQRQQSRIHGNDTNNQVVNSVPAFTQDITTAAQDVDDQLLTQLCHSLPATIEQQLMEGDSEERQQIIDGVISLTTDYSQDPDLSSIFSTSTTSQQSLDSATIDFSALLSPVPQTRSGMTRQQASSAPGAKAYKGGRQREEPPSKFSTETEKSIWYKERERKDNHNNIEKRRRYFINDCIIALGEILPKELFSNHVPGKEEPVKNKGTILDATLRYIRELQEKTELGEQQQQVARKVVETNRELILRCGQLENLLSERGVEMPGGAQAQLYAQPHIESKSYLDKLEKASASLRPRVMATYPNMASPYVPPTQSKQSLPRQFLTQPLNPELVAFNDEDPGNNAILGDDVHFSQPMDTEMVAMDFNMFN